MIKYLLFLFLCFTFVCTPAFSETINYRLVARPRSRVANVPVKLLCDQIPSNISKKKVIILDTTVEDKKSRKENTMKPIRMISSKCVIIKEYQLFSPFNTTFSCIS